MADEETIVAGDVVVLRSGSHAMTVGWADSINASCYWHSEGYTTISTMVIPLAALKLVEKAAAAGFRLGI